MRLAFSKKSVCEENLGKGSSGASHVLSNDTTPEIDTYMETVIGIDVGTGSARAGVFTTSGGLLASATTPIALWREGVFAEQSSENIWQAVCESVRQAVVAADIPKRSVKGIGFDATCSLVAIDETGAPVSLSPKGSPERNIIVWLDHRAEAQAERINALGHPVLDYVGGRISPEMQTPKLLWLQEELPSAWKKTAHFFDLPDFLTWRATGSTARSLCSTVCKWTYLGHSCGWDASFFQAVGLHSLVEEGFSRIGTQVQPIGSSLSGGLHGLAAEELQLPVGTPVGASVIDAHAGGIGIIGAAVKGRGLTRQEWNERLALICGTSSCHMAVSPQQRFVPGVWGPYYSAMLPKMWLNEGGQSAAGALIDHILETHSQYVNLQRLADTEKSSVYRLLNVRLQSLAEKAQLPFLAGLSRERHILPYFHGNRSPRADASLRGVISGLTLDDSLDDLAITYLAAIQAVAHGTKHIVDTLNAHGYAINTVFACGGLSKNPLFLQEHADILGCRIVLPRQSEAVLLGAACLGATAAGLFADIPEAMAGMSRVGQIIEPAAGDIARYHRKKHRVFLRMHDHFLRLSEIMTG